MRITLTQVQQFASPGWPIRYPRNQNCTWILRAAQGYVVHLSAIVQLEGPDQEDGTCRYDRIAFSLGNLLKKSFDGDHHSLLCGTSA